MLLQGHPVGKTYCPLVVSLVTSSNLSSHILPLPLLLSLFFVFFFLFFPLLPSDKLTPMTVVMSSEIKKNNKKDSDIQDIVMCFLLGRHGNWTGRGIILCRVRNQGDSCLVTETECSDNGSLRVISTVCRIHVCVCVRVFLIGSFVSEDSGRLGHNACVCPNSLTCWVSISRYQLIPTVMSDPLQVRVRGSLRVPHAGEGPEGVPEAPEAQTVSVQHLCLFVCTSLPLCPRSHLFYHRFLLL